MCLTNIIYYGSKAISEPFKQAYYHPIPTASIVASFASSYFLETSAKESAFIGFFTFITLGLAKFTLCKSSQKISQNLDNKTTNTIENSKLLAQKNINTLTENINSQSNPQQGKKDLILFYDLLTPIIEGYNKDIDGNKEEKK